MKVIKIKNLKLNDIGSKFESRADVVRWLTELVVELELAGSPLVQLGCRPTEDFYVMVINEVIVPAYISVTDHTAHLLWVHPDYRRRGYAKYMVETLNVKYTFAVQSSVPFWRSLGFACAIRDISDSVIAMTKR
jgi:GNAT superfamily N-acetyltransferase